MTIPSEKYRPGFFFWTLAPCLIIFMVAVTLLGPERTPASIIVISALDGLCLLVFLGLLNPIRFWWAWRGVGFIVFLAYCAYLVSMIIEGGEKITIGKSKADPSIINAVLGMAIFGVPGIWFAITGRLSFKKEEIDEDLGSGEAEH